MTNAEHWAHRPLAGLDLETDGADPADAHIITVGLAHWSPAHGLRRWSRVLRPTRPIPDAAAAVHGYATERAQAEGMDPGQALTELADVLDRAWTSTTPLVVYNGPFDLTIVDRELGRYFGGALEVGDRHVIDPFLIDKQADRWRKGERKLSVTCAHYGVALDAAHDALADVTASLELARRLGLRTAWPVGRYGRGAPGEIEARSVLAGGDPATLHAAQGPWFKGQALSLAEYFRTPKAVDKIERDLAAGAITAERAAELRSTLLTRADDVEAHADGWPMRGARRVRAGFPRR